jgi:hypothetical protein
MRTIGNFFLPLIVIAIAYSPGTAQVPNPVPHVLTWANAPALIDATIRAAHSVNKGVPAKSPRYFSTFKQLNHIASKTRAYLGLVNSQKQFVTNQIDSFVATGAPTWSEIQNELKKIAKKLRAEITTMAAPGTQQIVGGLPTANSLLALLQSQAFDYEELAKLVQRLKRKVQAAG